MSEENPPPPPSYSETIGLAKPTPIPATTSTKPRPLIITLRHVLPGSLSARGKVLAGKELEILHDAITINDDLDVHGICAVMRSRIKMHFGIDIRATPAKEGDKAGGDWRFALALFLGSDLRMRIVDEESWGAAKGLLLDFNEGGRGREVDLELWFAEVPGEWEERVGMGKGSGKRGAGKCVVQ